MECILQPHPIRPGRVRFERELVAVRGDSMPETRPTEPAGRAERLPTGGRDRRGVGDYRLRGVESEGIDHRNPWQVGSTHATHNTAPFARPAMPLADQRIDYALHGLHESEAGADPLALFQRWLDDAIAARIREPNAMTLATATPD